jgi:hypothetical protein
VRQTMGSPPPPPPLVKPTNKPSYSRQVLILDIEESFR